ncbi:1,2-phenylacetyl-CoA epoxidase subunit PaaD [Aliikangiella sp. G2MR2-5]|uniref:1,2-phenylacetyl-CoA epoxidase subunit PaaD n=1 Tax=Aliikangiella sp. G2MR2-5 TaxID=2788943 RepID=UPI0018AA3F15|nr:1,2-phenylacetyl-CoA epoxidase subunit PaaD [Aliikangiella sp. G2MR2-5]
MSPSEKVIPTLNPVYAARLNHRNNSPHQKIWEILDNVFDPELPGLTIWDLGILQDVQLVEGEDSSDSIWRIVVTPTYSGCPAVETINQDIVTTLNDAGYLDVKVDLVLSPAWSTEMVSPAGKAHLKSINIAPPNEQDQVCCPKCESENTKIISQFGSTACKAFYQCNDCFETFDYFKHF